MIICEPSNPWMSGVANLFTVEFYELIQKRLKPDGIAVLWFHAYGLEKNCIESVLKSMYHVFPNSILFKGDSDSDIYFIARNGKKPLEISEEELQNHFSKESAFIHQTYGTKNFKELLKKYLFKESNGLEELTKNAPLNTDDNMYLEFSAGRFYNSQAQIPSLGKRYTSQKDYQEFLKAPQKK